MTNTLTMDASHKVKGGGSHRKAFLRHICREADEKQGINYNHRNRNIVADRTKHNTTMVNDGAGGFTPGGSAAMDAYLDQRLESVKRPMRKDAVLMRPLILQMDPEWFDEHCPDWKETGDIGDEGRRLTSKMLEWATGKFGQENIVGTSMHLDEYSPQLHVVMTPVTSDGRLSQKDYFPNPLSLKLMHAEFRDFMEAEGYEVDKTVRPRSQERTSSEEYQRNADRRRELKEEAEDLRDEAEVHEMKTGVEQKTARRDRVAAAEDRVAAREELFQAKQTRTTAKAEGHAEGRSEGLTEGRAEGQRELDAARAAVERQKAALAALEEEWAAAAAKVKSYPPAWGKFMEKQPRLAEAYGKFAATAEQAVAKSRPKTYAEAQAELEAKTSAIGPTAGEREFGSR